MPQSSDHVSAMPYQLMSKDESGTEPFSQINLLRQQRVNLFIFECNKYIWEYFSHLWLWQEIIWQFSAENKLCFQYYKKRSGWFKSSQLRGIGWTFPISWLLAFENICMSALIHICTHRITWKYHIWSLCSRIVWNYRAI